MLSDFNSLSDDEKYNLLKAVDEKVRAQDGNGDEFAFKEDDGYVNLIAARGFNDGKSCVSRNDVHDDSIFVVFKDKKGSRAHPHLGWKKSDPSIAYFQGKAGVTQCTELNR